MVISGFRAPPSGQGAGGEARTRDRWVPADLRADSLTTVPPTPQNWTRLNALSWGVWSDRGKILSNQRGLVVDYRVKPRVIFCCCCSIQCPARTG
ncbi:hypothetical protein PoB_003418200 [Plakobranchus ocellatus]|uniref:Uncharacterized protein n=1 Tax=Plakobranchus ocellatus TaxID=259542 RepID=A0AAV4AL97_9GAST|nr:hypothetical protein PoB_003418200 [Plakobranchus ocellatus]